MSGFPNGQSNPAGAIPVWIAGGGGGGSPVPPPGMSFKGYQLLDLTDGAAHLLTVPAGSQVASVSPEAGNVRWLIGSAPTSTNGYPIYGTGQQLFAQGSLATVEFIEMSGSTTTKLSVVYYG